ncbi:carbohydrate kinase [Butyrivibrio sp. X503]|uniref:FGGY-family carbohydrate kinase n=1 Tax=Butyrivibrio sp. X503 TaxID=2364878 RepID=UPI000EAABD76|nr:FGGY-family carbohydrate kinase [Butyrivibrio sp. X503]RKM58047.1 carbohydrate kinase [Butyrivibrio sp. X503]
MRYYLGLDNGGTNTKAALFTKEGKQVAVESIATAAITPAPDFVERDMDQMWDDNCTVIRELIKKNNIDPADIAGIGLCGHGKGLYLWGKDGHPVRRGIISSDNRAWKYYSDWKKDGTEEKAFELSCQHIMACQPVCLLAWIRDNEPENMDNIEWIFECKDYVRFRLTGEARAEITDYSGTGLMNLHTASFDKELLKLFGIEKLWDALPPICLSTDIAGHITKEAAEATGLKEGTPVIGGMFDINACALAVNVTDDKNICMIAGTWSINEYPRKTAVLDGSVQMNSIFCLPGYYLIEESSPTSAGNNEWFIRQLLPELKEEAKKNGGSIYDIMNEWCEEFEPKDFVPVFLPFLTASNVNPLARAAFVGLDASHTRHHMLRAVYEGIVYSHRWHLDRLMNTRDSKEAVIRLAGGVAKSKAWTQMFADVMNLPVETVDVDETGALGCAIAVATAVGDYMSVTDAADHMCRMSEPILPRAWAHDDYEKKYLLYKKVIEALDSTWSDMQEIIGG